MDTIVCNLGKSFYFCTVKNHERHEVVAKSSAYRVLNLVEIKHNPNECGSSNAHKGFAHDTLTARTGVFIMSKNYE